MKTKKCDDCERVQLVACFNYNKIKCEFFPVCADCRRLRKNTSSYASKKRILAALKAEQTDETPDKNRIYTEFQAALACKIPFARMHVYRMIGKIDPPGGRGAYYYTYKKLEALKEIVRVDTEYKNKVLGQC